MCFVNFGLFTSRSTFSENLSRHFGQSESVNILKENNFNGEKQNVKSFMSGSCLMEFNLLLSHVLYLACLLQALAIGPETLFLLMIHLRLPSVNYYSRVSVLFKKLLHSNAYLSYHSFVEYFESS